MTSQVSPREQAFNAFLDSARLSRQLVLLAVALSASCLGIGFYLDDFVGRYVYSDLPGAWRMLWLWVGGYGLANGKPADTHWQIENGWAPWWTYDKLLIRLFRPFGFATHWLDSHFWPNSAWLQHLHSLFWLALLVWATTRMYRVALGLRIGGLAALLFACDHTHGFVVGYICNRHTLITALLMVLGLERHLTAHTRRSALQGGDPRGAQALAYLLYPVALASGEGALAMFGYVAAHALCVERTPWSGRAVRLLPYGVITLVWRVAYDRAGFGAFGSGLYIDPGRDPLAYGLALFERAPVLLLGQFLAPPAEFYSIVGADWARVILIVAGLFTLGLGFALWPLLRRDRAARFWLLGALLALAPAASTYPHNRQLIFASFGAMALLAQLWKLHALDLRGEPPARGVRFSRELSGLMFFAHVIVSPLALPLTTCSIALTAPLGRAPEAIGDEIEGRDVVFLSAPDYFAVKLVQLQRRIEGRPLARRWRALAFGPEHVRVSRSDPRTLELEYAEGILSVPFMELYRDRHIPMILDQPLRLEGLTIRVLELTDDGRARRVRFSFDDALEDPQFRFYYWSEGHFERLVPPAPGRTRDLPQALLDFSF